MLVQKSGNISNKWWNKRNSNYQMWKANNCVNYVSQAI
ncbi:amidase domain-containing protein [Enterococcus quebecensis]